jgi:hypothetical protein
MNSNWHKIIQSELAGDILQIPLVMNGIKFNVIGMVDYTVPNEKKAVLDSSRFIQKDIPVQFQDVDTWNIDVDQLTGEIIILNYSPDMIKKKWFDSFIEPV